MTMSCYEEIQAPTTAITLDQRNGVGGSTTGGGKGQQPPKSKQRRKFDSNIVGDYGGMEEWRDSNGNVALLGLMSPNLQNRYPLPYLLLVVWSIWRSFPTPDWSSKWEELCLALFIFLMRKHPLLWCKLIPPFTLYIQTTMASRVPHRMDRHRRTGIRRVLFITAAANQIANCRFTCIAA